MVAQFRRCEGKGGASRRPPPETLALRAQNPTLDAVVNGVNGAGAGCWSKASGCFQGCADSRVNCARWCLANYIPPPEEEGGDVVDDDMSVSGFSLAIEDDDSGAKAVLMQGARLDLVPAYNEFATGSAKRCCHSATMTPLHIYNAECWVS